MTSWHWETLYGLKILEAFGLMLLVGSLFQHILESEFLLPVFKTWMENTLTLHQSHYIVKKKKRHFHSWPLGRFFQKKFTHTITLLFLYFELHVPVLTFMTPNSVFNHIRVTRGGGRGKVEPWVPGSLLAAAEIKVEVWGPTEAVILCKCEANHEMFLITLALGLSTTRQPRVQFFHGQA